MRGTAGADRPTRSRAGSACAVQDRPGRAALSYVLAGAHAWVLKVLAGAHAWVLRVLALLPMGPLLLPAVTCTGTLGTIGVIAGALARRVLHAARCVSLSHAAWACRVPVVTSARACSRWIVTMLEMATFVQRA